MSNYTNLRALYGHEASVNKNEVTGTVYTPKWLAQQMIFQLIDSHISPSISLYDLFIDGYLQNVIRTSFAKQAKMLLNKIESLTIMDLSCGSGVLLLTYLEFIEYLAKCGNLNVTSVMKHVIEDCIYGIDIDRDAIAVFNETLNAYFEKLSISPAKTNIYCGNSLIENFVNEIEFDFIIGNPPYIGEKNNLEWFQPIKETPFGKKYYEGKMDYFYFFIYRAWELLKGGGTICYLSSNYFLSADGARNLRSFLKDNLFFDRYIDYGESRVFPERKLHACIYVLKKQSVESVKKYDENYQIEKIIPYTSIYQDDNNIKFISSDAVQQRIDQIKMRKIGLLGDLYQVHQGIVSGSDVAFVYNESDLSLLPVEALKYAVPFYKNSDVKHYYANKDTKLRLLYLNHNAIDENVITWMQQYKHKLSARREVIKGIREWYTLTWPRDANIFEKEKIVVPQRAKTNRFAYVEGSFYASADVYYIQLKENSPYNLKILCLILNASAYYEWLKHMGKRKGQLLELYATPLKAIPIIKLSDADLAKLDKIAFQIFDGKYDEINRMNDTEFKLLMDQVDEIIDNKR
ncbi:Eco57I restriction-modification methylase domain-containing protein [Fusibacter bizertensis]